MIGKTNFTNCENFERFHGRKLKKIKGKAKIIAGERLPLWSLNLMMKIVLIIFTIESDSRNLARRPFYGF